MSGSPQRYHRAPTVCAETLRVATGARNSALIQDSGGDAGDYKPSPSGGRRAETGSLRCLTRSRTPELHRFTALPDGTRHSGYDGLVLNELWAETTFIRCTAVGSSEVMRGYADVDDGCGRERD
uniref:Transposase n=1 Tax=Steinernema glaseri TaxID=37863 RepID=A0A1I7Y5L2_9BILA